MIRIRPYEEKDREAVEQICLQTASDELRSTRENREGTLDVWCHYYIEREPQNCFVAADDKDDAIGYILCAQDFQSWRDTFLRDYVEPSTNAYTQQMGRDSTLAGQAFAPEYPAHLHIDILPEYQHGGIGMQLLSALKDHLRSIKVPGVMLTCGADNQKGLGYYRKAGFATLEEGDGYVVFGMKLV